MGVVGDWIGRRWGLLQDCALMLLGLVMLTSAWGVTEEGWVICYAWSLFVYGVGVGGEYPYVDSSAFHSQTDRSKYDSHIRNGKCCWIGQSFN